MQIPSAFQNQRLWGHSQGVCMLTCSPGWGFSMGTNYHFHSWRVFVIVCALPCTVSMVALKFMPESPRFLLEMGKHDEAWMILKHVHDTNMRAKGAPEKVFTSPGSPTEPWLTYRALARLQSPGSPTEPWLPYRALAFSSPIRYLTSF
ncbi:hypothetical protein J1605_017024 [Eschrichtius robustus]|uniref:Uncharacterized protein n=1 Tax=Eschrichtius robustus TaxID=9764 RepID=A0AB34HYF0_ESCRO|nr:hypothetical protein J1605_017024 [Eschrichtius robustus]